MAASERETVRKELLKFILRKEAERKAKLLPQYDPNSARPLKLGLPAYGIAVG
jgi:type VI protein secretion system component VasF